MVPPGDSVVLNVVVYGATVLVGVGGAVVFVTSLILVADLVGEATVTINFLFPDTYNYYEQLLLFLYSFSPYVHNTSFTSPLPL